MSVNLSVMVELVCDGDSPNCEERTTITFQDMAHESVLYDACLAQGWDVDKDLDSTENCFCSQCQSDMDGIAPGIVLIIDWKGEEPDDLVLFLDDSQVIRHEAESMSIQCHSVSQARTIGKEAMIQGAETVAITMMFTSVEEM